MSPQTAIHRLHTGINHWRARRLLARVNRLIAARRRAYPIARPASVFDRQMRRSDAAVERAGQREITRYDG